jgi:ABC-type spermidine/putrescine transport system permease subunit I
VQSLTTAPQPSSPAGFRALGRRWQPQPSIWSGLLLSLPLLLVMVLLVFWPLAQLVYDSLTKGDGPANYAAFFASNASTKALLTTLRDSAVVTALAVVLGAVLAWNIRMQTSSLHRAILWAITLMPFWMGVVVKNYAFTIILQRKGIVNEALQLLPFVDEPLGLLYTSPAVVMGILYSLLPYAVLSLYVTFATIDPDLVRAAESLGAARYRALATVAVPLAIPGLLATAAIIFVFSIGFYVTPILLGGPQSAFVATLINRQIFSMFDYPAAAASGTLLLAAALVTLALAWVVVGRERIARAIV